jgi:26S proteasome regulatory subunit N1
MVSCYLVRRLATTLYFVVRLRSAVALALVRLCFGFKCRAGLSRQLFPAAGSALAGILAVLHACLEMKSTIASKYHTILFCLAPAMKPRMLMTLDEEGKMLPVPVRVGQAVDVVAQAGRPKSITGETSCIFALLLAVVRGHAGWHCRP